MGMVLYLFSVEKNVLVTSKVVPYLIQGKSSDEDAPFQKKEVVYWRKSVVIFNWFSDQLYDGKYEAETPKKVTREQLVALVNHCQNCVDSYDRKKKCADALGQYCCEPDLAYYDSVLTIVKVNDVINCTDFENYAIWYVPIL